MGLHNQHRTLVGETVSQKLWWLRAGFTSCLPALLLHRRPLLGLQRSPFTIHHTLVFGFKVSTLL
jgi:hypothetical protein